MQKGILFPLLVSMGLATQANALELEGVLATLGLGGTADGVGLPVLSGDGTNLDGVAAVRLGEDMIITSPTTAPLVKGVLLDPPTEDGQVIAHVTIGEGQDNLLSLDQLDGLLGGLTGGDGDGGLLSLDGLLGGVTGDDDGGLVGTVGGVVDGLTGGLTGGGDDDSGDLVGGLVDTVNGLTGGLLD